MSSLFDSLQENHPVKDVPDLIKPHCSPVAPIKDFQCPCVDEWHANIEKRLKAITEEQK